MRPGDALELVRRHQIVTLVPTGEIPSLVVAVIGSAPRGSWWGHPQGGAIYACAEALDHSGEVLCTKLVAGKVTFVHRALWPALYRVVTDPAWRRAARARLDEESRALLAEIERAGELRLDRFATERGVRVAALKAAKDAIERGLCAQSGQEHTERGRHATLFRTWERWAPAEVKAAAHVLGFDGALAAVRQRCGGEKTALG